MRQGPTTKQKLSYFKQSTYNRTLVTVVGGRGGAKGRDSAEETKRKDISRDQETTVVPGWEPGACILCCAYRDAVSAHHAATTGPTLPAKAHLCLKRTVSGTMGFDLCIQLEGRVC